MSVLFYSMVYYFISLLYVSYYKLRLFAVKIFKDLLEKSKYAQNINKKHLFILYETTK